MASDRRKSPSEPFIEDAHRYPEEPQKKRRPPSPEPDARRRRVQQRRKRNSVFRYIAFLFAAAFVLLLYTFMLERRQSQQQIDDLKQSNSAAQTLQGLIDENGQLKTETEQMKDQIKELQGLLAAAEEEQGLLQAPIQGVQKTNMAMHWFWQINDASVRGKTKLCRELITALEETKLQDCLPKENITGTDRFSPYDRYMEIRGKVIK